MKCSDIIKLMETSAPPEYACGWDNCGLLVGRKDKEVYRVMVALDPTKNVIEQAIREEVDMLITHHPMIFSAMKRVTDDDFIGRKIMMLVANDISYYAAHTNMDAAVMADIAAETIKLVNPSPLEVIYSEKLFKIAVFVPVDSADKVRKAMVNQGAGYIGDYSSCTFNSEGDGTFLPLEGTKPYIGEVGQLETTREIKIETVVTQKILDNVVKAMIKVHPYEEVAYDIYELNNTGMEQGIGRVGYLANAMELSECANLVKKKFGIDDVRIIGSPVKKIMKAAISPGAGKSMVSKALKAGVDVLITGDIDHHTALDAYEQGLCIIDAGHFGTEHFVVDYIKDYLINNVYEMNSKVRSGEVEFEVIKAREKEPFIYM